jgi:hypothetical protein
MIIIQKFLGREDRILLLLFFLGNGNPFVFLNLFTCDLLDLKYGLNFLSWPFESIQKKTEKMF